MPPEVMTRIVMTLMDDPELKQLIEEEYGGYEEIGAMMQEQQMMNQQQGSAPKQKAA